MEKVSPSPAPLSKPSPSKLSEADRQRIETNRAAALQRLEESSKRRAAEAVAAGEFNLESDAAVPSPSNNGPCKPKRAKTEAEVRREEELKDVVSHGQVVRVQGTKLIDTGGGFLLEENDLIEEEVAPKNIIVEPAAIVPTETPTCEQCHRTFGSSYLLQNYDLEVCDACR